MKKTDANIKRIRKSILQLNVVVFFPQKVLCFFFVAVIVSGPSVGLQT